VARRLVVPAVGLAGLLAVAALAGCTTRYGSPILRPSDPVVLTGAQVPRLLGADPQHVVAFSWDGSAWHQIPVQVDERDLVSPGVIYHLDPSQYPKLYGTSTLYRIPVYTPPRTPGAGYAATTTYTPPDSDPTLDADDEVSLLVDDTGRPTTSAAPDGVDAASRTQLLVTDPVTDRTGYAYLFTSSTLTGGSAGTTGVTYTFSLDSGDYLATYRMGPGALPPNDHDGPNPEHSEVTTPGYSLGFGDRWLNDSLRVTVPGADGSDLLDRSKYYATKVSCGRTEDTFDAILGYKGAFIANLSGPVRAIRSVIGANSFGYTALTDVFYPDRQDSTVELRGHAGMPGFGEADDLATGLAGTTYSDPANTGIPVDGVADRVTPITWTTGGVAAPPSWQVVTGPAGAVITTRRLVTDLTGLTVATTWRDQAGVRDCTGDASTWGQGGFEVTSPTNSIPNTDPTLGTDPPRFTAYRTRYFASSSFRIADASALEARSDNPLVVSVG